MARKFTPIPCDPIDWLLDPEDPSTRYLALTRLLDKPVDDPVVQEAYRKMFETGPVALILSSQDPSGWWGNPDSATNPFYTSTAWQIYTLAELGAHLPNYHIERGCDFLFRKTQSDQGDFPPTGHNFVKKTPTDMLCADGLWIWALLRVGTDLMDARMRRAVDFLTEAMLQSGGACRFNEGKLCAWGCVKGLRALAEVPEAQRSDSLKQAIQQAADFLMDGDLAHADYPIKEKGRISDHWFRFGFPRNWMTDVLQVLVILASLGYAPDDRLKSALDVLLSKRLPDGTWKCEETIARLPVALDRRGHPSKRITLDAMYVLKRANIDLNLRASTLS